MILYNLRCAGDHEFEAWFKDSGTFDRQVEAGEVACPVCGDVRVGKAIMAPRLSRAARKGADETPHPAQMRTKYLQALREMRRNVEENCDYVGPDFAAEALKIHNGETDERNIYGEATEDETKALIEEDVPFGRVPWVPREDA
ncbi:MAG: DUF1178 family protein [Defluviicoccus sp.]|nr:DUF1178 family protein [Defluviicoccus sp.]